VLIGGHCQPWTDKVIAERKSLQASGSIRKRWFFIKHDRPFLADSVEKVDHGFRSRKVIIRD
jgi:hypothetical protein